MAKAPPREYVWMQCTECKELNYRVQVRTQGGGGKLEMKKYCSRDRKHTVHKTKKK